MVDKTKVPFPNSGVPQDNALPKSNAGPAPTNNALAPNTRPTYDNLGPSGMQPFAKSPFPSGSGAEVGQDQGADRQESTAFSAESKIQLNAVGNSGTQIFGGYFSEEYLHNLRGRQGAKQWDEMRRSDAQVSMLMNAITNPIKSAKWDVEPYLQEGDYGLHSDLCQTAIQEMIDFTTFLHEALTFIPFGYSMFEVVHSISFDHPRFGTFNGLKSLAFRSQKTIENWQLEQKTGRLIGVNQYTYSDLGGNQFIPGEFLLVLTHSKEGDNYEGISALRPMYGPYIRKNLYLKLAAIGLEKYAVGTPIGTVPKGKEKTTEFTEFKKTLQNYTSHECAYITKPDGWAIEIQKAEFKSSEVKEMLLFENTEMVNALVANFLALGMNGSGGAYALGSNLGEFFTSGIQSYADLVCDVVNRELFPNLVKLNFGPQQGYPKLKCTGISDKAGKELAEAIKFLSDSRVLDPDMPLKEWLRKQYGMPKPDPKTAVAMPAIPAGGSANYPKPSDPVINPETGKLEPYAPSQLLSERSLKLAESKPKSKYIASFDKSKRDLKKIMQNNLTDMYQGLKDILKTRYNSLSGTDKILAAKGVSMPKLNNYKAALRNSLAEIAANAIQKARKEVPKSKNVKLVEQLESIKLGPGYYDALPPNVRKLVEIQANLVAETQSADIEKTTFFQFTSSATTTDDIDTIFFDVDNSVEPMIEGSTEGGMSIDAAAGDAVAHVIQESRFALFFDDEVLDGIESFTFTNEDPVSEICQAMNGTTCSVGDPDLDTYQTPLHHNCKSRWVPNLKGDSSNPDAKTGPVSLSKKAIDSITL